VNLFYVDEVSMGRIAALTPRPSVDAEAWKDWRVLGFEDQGDARWHLWARRAWAEEARGVFLLRRLNAERDIVPRDAVRALANAARPPVDGLFCGYGWHGPRASRRHVYRWVDRDAEIVVTSPSGRRRRMVLDVEPGPAADSRPLEVSLVEADGREVARATVRAREEVAFALPLEAGASRVFRLRLGQGGDPGAPPGREPAARVFRLAWADRP
jgi:hypothetical protein